MKRFILILLSLMCICTSYAQDTKQIPTIYVDKKGTLCWSDTNKEASFYGVNYTLPFAHGYRVLNYLGKDHKEAIDRDVYHFARLGFNAYRIHIWDVEISDRDGNLVDNDHLNLLDYLIMKLRERNIRVLITTMTNFGNGYPEKNQNTGAFSYLYDKCSMHSDENSIKAQEQYISQLVKHTNPYTNLSYANDPFIIGFEINNEPCHAETPKQTEVYINRMLTALKNAGNKKPVFYNVSHNMDHVQAYFNTAIQGTTYQWYPLGLVAGHTRKGNFLPNVDNYLIPFSSVKGFDKKAKAVYEFDPADITYSYMYPAMTRTFRATGFQWMTQFAYDPIDIAWANSEYQTHFLNLAYTPSKAISMKIAAEVAYNLPMNKEFPQYPNDTIFDNFRVSYAQDLSEMNSPDKFFYSNTTTTQPKDVVKLKSIAGYGDSPLIQYEGKGAYFLDKLENGVWRLEVMPDAVEIDDPYAKPSLNKEVVTIVWNTWNMTINIPELGSDFSFRAINPNNHYSGKSSNNIFSINPGVYILSSGNNNADSKWNASSVWNNIRLGEYVAPEAHANRFSVMHQPAKVAEQGDSLKITADIVGPSFPDSVIIYTDKVSFWADNNPYVNMKRVHGYTYEATIPADMITEGVLKYNIIVNSNGKKITYPDGILGTPLDWDFYKNNYYETKIVNKDAPIELVKISDSYSDIDTYAIPEASYLTSRQVGNGFTDEVNLLYTFHTKNDDARFYWKKYIKEYLSNRIESLEVANNIFLKIKVQEDVPKIKVGFETTDGYTYTALLNLNSEKTMYSISISDFVQDKTTFLPAPYPTFLERYFEPTIQIPFNKKNIESLIISTDENVKDNSSIQLGSIWIQ